MSIPSRKSEQLFKLSRLPLASAIGMALAIPAAVNAAPSGRQIEEVVVTAERQEASVQDTSISITAFTSEMLEDFGIKDQTDLQNFIPATVILPYDATVRGVGRNFRSLGGDPGISTYMNGVYSEDLYTATIGSFWDMERIEVLRGPQGTLYGRNAVGGAMNFLYNRPSQEFDYRFKASAGNYNAQEFYGMVNGALIEDQLAARVTFSNRQRDGYIEERGPVGEDLDSRGEENYAGQLNWTPTDNLQFNIRANRANVHRVMGGADGGGLVVFRGESDDGNSRNIISQQGGFREIDRTATDPLANNFYDARFPVSTFTDRVTGRVIEAQQQRAGIDEAISTDGRGARSNDVNRQPFGNTAAELDQCVLDRENIDGDNLCAITNGQNVERFHQQGVQFDINWDVNDSLALKYIYGYNKLSYQRITDDDSGSAAVGDRQFYVNHEATYESHEIQAFYDITENLSFTSGFFIYDAIIDQRGDFYSQDVQTQGTESMFSQAPSFDPASQTYDPVGAAFAAGALDAFLPFSGANQIDLFSAKEFHQANNLPNQDNENNAATQVLGGFHGDAGGVCGPGAPCKNVTNGPSTSGSELLYTTQTVRDSIAIYTQGVWDISEKFTLTFGLRWAEDKLGGEENLWRTIQFLNPAVFAGAVGATYDIDPTSQYYDAAKAAGGVPTNLAEYNVHIGRLDPVTLDVVDGQIPLAGMMGEVAVYRVLDRTDDEITYRLNLDWDLNDNSMMYFSVTTGYRAGGYNLVFFSTTPTYDPEELIAYEIGYKGNLLDNTLQLNASAYLYDYSSIHTFVQEISVVNDPVTGVPSGSTAASVLPAPGAQIYGFEVEALWLATDRMTFGGNLSYTPSEYTEDFVVGDGNDIRCPNNIIDPANCRLNINGNQVLNVPEYKGSAWGAYNWPLGENGAVEFLMTASWISETFNSQYETQFDRSPGYERLDARINWTSPNNSWVVTGYVNNILDEVGVRQIEGHGESEGFRRTGMVTEPMMYGLEVTYSLGN